MFSRTLLTAAGLFSSISVHAADLDMDTNKPQLQNAFQVTPYLWAAGLSGQISPFRRGPTIGVDKSFSDVFEDLNFGGFINIWARHDRFVFSGDIMYVNTTDSHAFGPLPALPVPVPPGITVEGRVDSSEFMATLQGGYRVIDAPTFSLDGLAGVRIWHVSNDVTVSALGMSRSYGESFGWVDPVVGARAFLQLSDRFSLQGQADIGGFGAGSDLTWSALATLNYVINDHLSLSAGYKTLDVDYRKDGNVFDTRLQGPVLGATWRF